LLKVFKTEIKPTQEQIIKINKTIGTCRFIYNFYISHNKEVHESTGKFVSGYDFSKWLNNEFIPNNKEFLWIKEVSSKAVKQSIMNGEKAFKRFFKGLSKFPRYKKKSKQSVKCYFPKNNKLDWIAERHRIKIPTLGNVRLKEKGYIPNLVKSGTIEKKANRYYVSIICKIENLIVINNSENGIGIDLGIKDFAIVSSGKIYKNINKTNKVKKIEKKLKREQKRLSRKYESHKKIKIKEKEKTTRQNIQKQIVKVQKLYQNLTNIRTDYINKTVNEIVKTKPSYITIEDLNVRGMMKNRHLSKAIAQQKFYEFKTKLQIKCSISFIELRIVDRFYPSSKTCSQCGNIKKDLKLSDRIYKCKCGLVLDRDLNAAINLEGATQYKTA
jgi:putative transposase